MIDRRTLLAGVSATGALALAGCTDILEDEIEAEAAQTTISEETLDETGYEYVESEAYVVDDTVDAAGIERDVDVTSWISTYAKDIEGLELDEETELSPEEINEVESQVEDALGQDGAGFVVLSTPDETVMGVDLNPVARYDDDELIEEFNDDIVDGEVTAVEESAEHNAVLLGDDITVNEYLVTVETGDGNEFEADVFLAQTTNEDDIVLAAGAQPVGYGEDEQFLALIEGIEHPVDTEE